ncbi:SOS response-associated peptidase family protein [Leptospira mtsangambouensis]|uniref:SOS response-associated peptidase family protein n=1 Tax=Leptospira mtsangambouensis TaxID=2484912 RepID=UPI001EEA6166|nr:SOS response-associated peptidase family protein [Leptospira mtsangambouensis]MCG6140639.1 SOS response-associated peptidase [Leptospira mtsangambouensis]
MIENSEETQRYIRLEFSNDEIGFQKKIWDKISGYKNFIRKPSEIIQSFSMTERQIVAHLDPWGVNPSWSKRPIMNTQSEKLFDSPFWKNYCNNLILVPVVSFFEWQLQTNGKKHKYEITFKNTDSLFAGIWGEEGRKRWITILTQTANEKMKKIHNSGDNKHRQPVVIQNKFAKHWIDSGITNRKDVTDMITQFQPDDTTEQDLDEELTLFG